MKDTNFDSIKEKFDNSGVNAPESLDENMVLAKLYTQQPVQMVPPKKKKKKLAAGISAAAAVAVITAGAITATTILGNQPQQQKALTAYHEKVSLRSFKSRDEVTDALKKAQKIGLGSSKYSKYIYEGYEAGNITNDSASATGSTPGLMIPNTGAAVNSSSSGAASLSHNSTYTQALGVDEADSVKTTDKYIFYMHYSVNGNVIEIISADGKDAKSVAKVEAEESEYVFHDFYVYGDKLITLGVGYNKKPFADDDAKNHYYTGYFGTTQVNIYDISDIDSISLSDSFSQSGEYISSRMIGGMLYVVSNDRRWDEDEDYLPLVSGATEDSAELSEMPVEDIYAVEQPSGASFLVVSSINTDDGAHAEKTKAILGSADIIYCNQDNLYVTAYEYSPLYYRDFWVNDVAVEEDGAETSSEDSDKVTDDYVLDFDVSEPEETRIIKISLDEGLDFVADGTVKGRVNNQYSLDEHNGYLRVATTTFENDTDVNNLFVLDQNLAQTGSVTGFAKGESIKAVRYIGDTAYVITYEQTDPLFVIDTSNPSAPKILGEVKISGFSTLLVPVDENTLLGIGYHTEDHEDDDIDMEIQEGVKLVVFDVTDKANPKVLDTKVFENYSSPVQYDPKSLLVNFERGDYTIPMDYYHWEERIDGDVGYRDYVDYKAGVLNFRVENGKIVIIDDYTSKVFDTEDKTLDRCVYVGNNIYLLGTSWDWNENEDHITTLIDSVEYK